MGALKLADTAAPLVKQQLRALHPQEEPVAEEEMADAPGQEPYATTRLAFNEIFSKPPKERGIGIGDVFSYEELQHLYHGGKSYQLTLYSLVAKINAGAIHPAGADIIGDSLLYGLEKPDGGTRPIGVGGALRRLAGRVLMRDSCIWAWA